MAKEISREENKDPAFIKLIDDLNNTAAQNPVSIEEGIGQALESVNGLSSDHFPSLEATIGKALNIATKARVCTIVCAYSDQGVAGLVTDNSIEEVLALAKRFPGVIEQLGKELVGSDNGIAQLLAALARSGGGAS